MKTSAVPRSGFFRRHGVLLTATGFLLGAAAGTFIYTVERPVYESTAQFRPLRPPTDVSGISHGEWLQNEVTALGSEQCLLRVVKNLNLENEYHMPAGEAVAELQKQIHVSVLPGSTVVSVTIRGQKAGECARLVNEVTVARDEMTKAAIQESYKRERQRCQSGVQSLTASVEARHLALLDVTRKQGVAADAVANANLTAAAKTAREAWVAEKAQLAEMRVRLAATEFPPFPSPYAEILQEGKLSVEPIVPAWFPRTARWSVIGTAIGLTLALCLAAFRRRMDQSRNSPPVFPPRPVAAGEY
jgi:capsular polysaccharide biosynthesis protein